MIVRRLKIMFTFCTKNSKRTFGPILSQWVSKIELWISSLGLPFRVYLRRFLSVKFEMAGLPVYFVRCERDFLTAQAALEKAFDLLRETSPFWHARIRNHFSCVMLVDSVRFSAFFAVDNCCGINPWQIVDNVEDEQWVPVLLVAALISAAAYAHVLGKRNITRRFRKYLGFKSACRFIDTYMDSSAVDLIVFRNVLRQYSSKIRSDKRPIIPIHMHKVRIASVRAGQAREDTRPASYRAP